MKNILSNRIKELRKQKGLSQEDLAKKIGVHLQTLSRYERGITEIPASILIKIADFLKPNLRWFLIGEGPMFIEHSPLTVSALSVAERRAPYDDITGEERDLIRLLRANPDVAGIVRKILGGREAEKEGVKDLQALLDLSPAGLIVEKEEDL
jgi:transcriptional regulator with XRE-family HTH domain